jgi:hypothetical protein
MTRLEPTLISGQAWRVDVCTGNRKKGTFRAVPVTEPVYTLAQAQTFCANNRAAEFAHLI